MGGCKGATPSPAQREKVGRGEARAQRRGPRRPDEVAVGVGRLLRSAPALRVTSPFQPGEA